MDSKTHKRYVIGGFRSLFLQTMDDIGTTPTAIARRAGISAKTVCDFAKERHDVTLNTFEKIMSALEDMTNVTLAKAHRAKKVNSNITAKANIF